MGQSSAGRRRDIIFPPYWDEKLQALMNRRGISAAEAIRHLLATVEGGGLSEHHRQVTRERLRKAKQTLAAIQRPSAVLDVEIRHVVALIDQAIGLLG